MPAEFGIHAGTPSLVVQAAAPLLKCSVATDTIHRGPEVTNAPVFTSRSVTVPANGATTFVLRTSRRRSETSICAFS